MSRSRSALALLGIVVAAATALAEPPRKYGIGREATPHEIAGWDIDVRPDGQGLPAGKGSAKGGEEIYMTRCATCHGEFGEGAGRWPAIAGGRGTLASHDPNKTVGSYFPYLSTLFDYTRHAVRRCAVADERRALRGRRLRALAQRHRRGGFRAVAGNLVDREDAECERLP